MTYRTKVFALLLLLVVVANGLLAYADYNDSDRLLRQEIHYKVRSIAYSTAAVMDPGAITSIRTPADQNSPAYANILKILLQVRDANRRGDTYVQRMFTLTVSSRDPKALQYGVETTDNIVYTRQVGDIYRIDGIPVSVGLEDLMPKNAITYYAGYRYDTAYGPVYDHSGKLVAAVGVVDIEPRYGLLPLLRPRVLITFAISLLFALILSAVLSRRVTKPLYELRKIIDAIAGGDFNAIVPHFRNDQFAEIATSLKAMETGLRERDTIRSAFSGYISRQVLDAVLTAGGTAALKGERRRITVLFADIRGFTTLSETMPPEDVVELLSEFFDRMVEVILRNQGTIDKFLGDGMMVIFGAPGADPYQEEHAVKAALEMQEELRMLCEKWQSQGRHPFRMGIGINSGNAIVGNIGSKEHMEYTAIGDTVNLASRLESESKTVGVEILVSEYTHEGARPLFKWKEAGVLHVKGREESVHAYSVEGLDDLRRTSPESAAEGHAK